MSYFDIMLRALAAEWRKRAAQVERDAEPETDPRAEVWDSCAQDIEMLIEEKS